MEIALKSRLGRSDHFITDIDMSLIDISMSVACFRGVANEGVILCLLGQPGQGGKSARFSNLLRPAFLKTPKRQSVVGRICNPSSCQRTDCKSVLQTEQSGVPLEMRDAVMSEFTTENEVVKRPTEEKSTIAGRAELSARHRAPASSSRRSLSSCFRVSARWPCGSLARSDRHGKR